MANDRTYVVCEKCLKVRHLTKYYPSTGAGLVMHEAKNLFGFYQEHIVCFEGGFDLGQGPLMSIVADDEFIRRGGRIGDMTDVKLTPLNPDKEPKE